MELNDDLFVEETVDTTVIENMDDDTATKQFVIDTINDNLEIGDLVRASELEHIMPGEYPESQLNSLLRSKVFYRLSEAVYVYSGYTKRFLAKRGWTGGTDVDFTFVKPEVMRGIYDFVRNADYNADILLSNESVDGIDYLLFDLNENGEESDFFEAIRLLEQLGWVDSEAHVLDATPAPEEFELMLMNQGISLEELNA